MSFFESLLILLLAAIALLQISRRFALPYPALLAGAGVAVPLVPIAAALVLGAIVAPPDAAAATAVLSGMAIPRRTDAVLRGESLFNDATALLLFSAALAVQ